MDCRHSYVGKWRKWAISPVKFNLLILKFCQETPASYVKRLTKLDLKYIVFLLFSLEDITFATYLTFLRGPYNGWIKLVRIQFSIADVRERGLY